MRLGEPVPAALRNAWVHGLDGVHTLGDLIRGPTLLVFLRHFGRMHGARQVDGILSRLPELERLGVAVVLAGYVPRRAVADRRQLGGACLVDGRGRVLHHRCSESPGDLIDPSDIVHAALELPVEERAAGRRV